jgi:hypothetical protein
MPMKSVLKYVVAACLPLVVAACGGDDNDETFFEVEQADQSAHAALLGGPDLPGSGWEATERDEPEDDSFDFEEAARNEAACSTFNDLAALSKAGGIFGGGDDSEPAGRAQVKHERGAAGQVLPTSVEMEVEILPTVAEVQGPWQTVKTILESDDFKGCMSQVISGLFQTETAGTGIEMTFAPRPSSSVSPPQDGAAVAFQMMVRVPPVVNISAVMEMYMWPFANAGVTLIVLGTGEQVTAEFVGDLLESADGKVVQAERDQ